MWSDFDPVPFFVDYSKSTFDILYYFKTPALINKKKFASTFAKRNVPPFSPAKRLKIERQGVHGNADLMQSEKFDERKERNTFEAIPLVRKCLCEMWKVCLKLAGTQIY